MVLEQFWQLFYSWLYLFYAPFSEPEMLWVIIPIYLGWIITEIYQEKRDTSYGNAVSNGVIVFWVGIDWTRTTIRLLKEKAISVDMLLYAKLFIAFLVFSYGVLILYLGIKGKKSVRYIARIREVSYILLVFTPIFYKPELLTMKAIIGIFVLFPFFYFLIEFIDWVTPDPKIYEYDKDEQRKQFYEPIGGEEPKDVFKNIK
ncbi:MAG: hypothetical protein QXK37_00645 [Candidatus Woesearchaeota archaeon]